MYYCLRLFCNSVRIQSLSVSRGSRYGFSAMAMPKLTLYGDEASPPVRFVMMTASMLGVELEFKLVDLFAGEHHTAAYKKINPLQKVPALVIGTEPICDSHAIVLYLCRIAPNELYPNDALARAKVDEMLLFNATTLFPLDSEILSNFFAGDWAVNQRKLDDWYKALDHLELKLTVNEWLAGNQMYLCDLCAAATIASMTTTFPILERHAKVKQWIEKLENVPCFEINKRGAKRLKYYLDKAKPSDD